MLYILFICGIILTLLLFTYNQFILGKTVTTNGIISIAFLLTSLLVAWIVNTIWNVSDKRVPLPKNPTNTSPNPPSSDSIDMPNINPSLLDEIKNLSL